MASLIIVLHSIVNFFYKSENELAADKYIHWQVKRWGSRMVNAVEIKIKLSDLNNS